MSIFDALSAPFPADVISWRAQSVSTKNPNAPAAMALAYIDARDVMRRLDDVCGPANWQCRYPHADKKTICEIGIKHGDEWIWKANGAGDTDIEAEKGAVSDAFKRAAVLWGIGRYLYDMPTVWAGCNLTTNGKWHSWTDDGLAKLKRTAESFGQATPKPEAPKVKPDHNAPITDAQREWLQTQCEAVGISAKELCDKFNVMSFKQLVFGQLTEAKTWIDSKKKVA